jgi:hypothetical protein
LETKYLNKYCKPEVGSQEFEPKSQYTVVSKLQSGWNAREILMGYPKEVVVRKVVIGPVSCYLEGKDLLGPSYWTFLGICLVGSILAGLIPIVLLGPAYCGIALCFLTRARGEEVMFDQLFKGFDFFMPGLIATLVYVGVFMVLVVPFVIMVILGSVLISTQDGILPYLGGFVLGIAYVSWILLAMIGWITYMFATMLIADKKLDGLPAMQYAFKGVLTNFWGIAGTVLVGQLMMMVGMMLCIVPGILLFPIMFAGHFMAYWKIFGVEQPQPVVAQAVD